MKIIPEREIHGCPECHDIDHSRWLKCEHHFIDCPLPDAPEWKDKPDLSCSLWAFRKNKYLPPLIFRLSLTYMDRPPILEGIGSQEIMYLDGLPPYYKTGKWCPVTIPTLPEEKQDGR